MRASPKNHVYQEGGWGWIVVFAACLSEFVVAGSLKAFGVLITGMKDDFDTGLWIIGSINSLHLGVQFILTPVASVVARKVGGRPVISFGGFLFGLGVVLSALTHNIAFLAVTIIAIAGSGAGCILEIVRAEFALYFHEKYDLAIFVSLLGAPIGFLLYGPATQILLDTYGWRGAMVILGGFGFHLICAGMLVRRPTGIYKAIPIQDLSTEDQTTDQNEYQTWEQSEDQMSKHCEHQISKQGEDQILKQSQDQISNHSEDQLSKKSEDQTSEQSEDQLSKRSAQGPDPVKWRDSVVSALGLEIFINFDFVLLAAIRMFYSISFGGILVYMVPNGLSAGLTNGQASFLSTAFGLGSMAGPALAFFVLKRKLASCQVTAIIAAAVSAVGLALDPFIPSFAGQMVNTFFVAAGIAAVIQVVCVLTRYLPFTVDKFVIVLGWLGFLGGLATSVGDTLAGLLYDVTESFYGTFFLYSAAMVATGLLFLLDLCRARYREWSKESRAL
ncbi:monocarboxylate transporter 9-like [Patiria miniata]|uniref:Major facilitator superfamily (MFS) profile domain-containing protein n=1 Tax=Patiria miniata TaxID=46514 RepID=A0A913ZP04_PATMI|nr:monocarboxylate transporter 9-like [Patiria miniata]